MNSLQRIEVALARDHLDPVLFERCAQDLLIEVFPGLAVIPGGTDWGRDADLLAGSDAIPPRLLVTTSQDYKGIRANLVSGLDSLLTHEVPFREIVLANPGRLSAVHQEKLREVASGKNARIQAVFGYHYFASALRRDGEWRQRLLGLSSDLITLSKAPWQFAERQWSDLQLLGRQALIDEIVSADADVILVGKPGVGKTRLLCELPDVAFVDADSDEGPLADDIRWWNPDFVAVDDVGQSRKLVRLVRRLRKQEDYLSDIRLIAVCWPDELEVARELVPGAKEITVDLLERADMDAIIQSMGVTAVMARQEILAQAEGRPGWAVALAGILLTSGWRDLLSGKALLGQADAYLRRSLISGHAQDLLAAIAALNGVTDDELSRLARDVEIPRTDMGRLLQTVTQSGLLDRTQHMSRDGVVASYVVRPPMLATAIAADHYFPDNVPLGDIADLLEQWPERERDIALTVCSAAQMGSVGARSAVDRYVVRLLSDASMIDLPSKLLESYLLIDAQTAGRSLDILRLKHQQLNESDRYYDLRRDQIVELLHLIAFRYFNKDAVSLMLDLALIDLRRPNQHPSHPLRKLEDLCTFLRPDSHPTLDHRLMVAQALGDWILGDSDEEHWRVWGAVVMSVLTPNLRGSYTSPDNIYEIRLIGTMVSSAQATMILEQLWPAVLLAHSAAPDRVAAGLLEAVDEWLRIGGGFGGSFGREHSANEVETGARVGRSMFDDLLSSLDGRRAALVRLASIASRYEIGDPSTITANIAEAEFFTDDNRQDWREAHSELRSNIEIEVAGWIDDMPQQTVKRLVDIREDLAAAGISWPDRVRIACDVLASSVNDLRPWVDEVLRQDLFPEASPLVDALIRKRPESVDLVEACLSNSNSRASTLESVLRLPIDEVLTPLAIEKLTTHDFVLLETMEIRREISLDVQREILCRAAPKVRGAFAVAMSGHEEHPDESIPEELRRVWLGALVEVFPSNIGSFGRNRFVRLLPYLAEVEPDVMEELVRRRLVEAGAASAYDALGHDTWDEVHILPRINKRSLIAEFADSPVRSTLLSHLVGSDADFLEALLEEDAVDPEEALQTRGFDGGVPLDRLAAVLVPRGIDPKRIAALALIGFWSGEESDHHQNSVAQFEAYLESEDHSVSSLGRVGVEMFSQERDRALSRERQARIRGEY